MKTFENLFFLLNRQEQKKIFLLFFMILLNSIFEILGVVSILPFITVLTNPELIQSNLVLNSLYEFSSVFGVKNINDFIFFSGALLFIFLISSLSFKALTYFIQLRFIHILDYSIAKRLIKKYLSQSYGWFLNHNSAEIGKNILSEVGQVVQSSVKPFIELLSKTVVAILLIIMLIAVDLKLTLIVSITILSVYTIIFFSLRRFNHLNGKIRLESNNLRYQSVNNAFSSIKEIKLKGLEDHFIKFFSNSAKNFAITQANAQLIRLLPRFFLEAVAFGGILLVILYLMKKSGNFNNSLPLISLYVFAGYRLIPSIQQIYSSITQINYINSALKKLIEDFRNLKTIAPTKKYQKSLYPKKKIELQNISFTYPGENKKLINNINFSIDANSSVGFIGPTGCGKTTIVDIILGLIQPQYGSILIDGQIISKENMISWQSSIGYVPQVIYLSDDTILANIAFGVKAEDINQELAKEVIKILSLDKFINRLPYKYHTKVGERGAKLSGGERQLIGIARALYLKPKVLILDEATSALDFESEKKITDSINSLHKEITIIMIAHRLNTLSSCDKIFKFDRGNLIDQGSFSKIIGSN